MCWCCGEQMFKVIRKIPRKTPLIYPLFCRAVSCMPLTLPQ